MAGKGNKRDLTTTLTLVFSRKGREDYFNSAPLERELTKVVSASHQSFLKKFYGGSHKVHCL